MKIAYPNSPRVGKFNLLYEVERDERPMCDALFALCRVLHVEDHESGRGKTYYSASPLFQPLAEGDEIPEYRLEFVHDQPFELPEREAVRVNSGKFGFVAIRKIVVRVPPLQMGVAAASPVLH